TVFQNSIYATPGAFWTGPPAAPDLCRQRTTAKVSPLGRRGPCPADPWRHRFRRSVPCPALAPAAPATVRVARTSGWGGAFSNQGPIGSPYATAAPTLPRHCDVRGARLEARTILTRRFNVLLRAFGPAAIPWRRVLGND